MQKTVRGFASGGLFFAKYKMKKVEVFIWPLIVLAAIYIYMIGVDGPFLFDDFANLNALGAHGGVDNWQHFWIYLSDGHSGPTGRPLSLVSFLINDNNWPSSPESFKYTNVLIHALNGCLLFLLHIKILRHAERFTDRQAFWVATLATSAWLFHPMFVSTTLYVVQRMAMLATTFVLVGLLSYLISRERLKTKPKIAYLGMSSSIVFFSILAALSKENGALLPVLVLVIESTVFAGKGRISKTWSGLFLWLPAIIICTYLIYVALNNGFFSKWPGRSFSPAERLLTEARVLWEYLFYLYSFGDKSGGLFNENYPVAEHLITPFSNLVAVMSLLLLLIGALVCRKKLLVLSLPILFFLAGHLVESTTVGLELYFEHRNYLPAIFLFLPVGVLLCSTSNSLQIILTLMFVFTIAVLLFFKVDIWSDKLSLATNWVKEAPHSIRAQRVAAITLTEHGQVKRALSVLDDAQDRFPQSHSLLIHRMILKCSLHENIEEEKVELLNISEVVGFEPKLSNLIDTFVSIALSGKCGPLNSDYALKVIEALKNNPKALRSDGFKHQLHYFSGVLKSRRYEPSLANSEFTAALDLRPRLGAALKIVSVLAADGHCQEALTFIDRGRHILRNREVRFGSGGEDYYEKEINVLEKTVTENCKVRLSN